LFSVKKQKEAHFVPKMRFYHLTTKSQKNNGIVAKIVELYGGTGGQTSPRPGNSGTGGGSSVENTQQSHYDSAARIP
jgi:hypothetical protein